MSELKMLGFNDLERVQAKNRTPLFLNALYCRARLCTSIVTVSLRFHGGTETQAESGSR